MGSRSELSNAAQGQVREPVIVVPDAGVKPEKTTVLSPARTPGLVPGLEQEDQRSPAAPATHQTRLPHLMQEDSADGNSPAQRGRKPAANQASGSEPRATRREATQKVTGDASVVEDAAQQETPTVKEGSAVKSNRSTQTRETGTGNTQDLEAIPVYQSCGSEDSTRKGVLTRVMSHSDEASERVDITANRDVQTEAWYAINDVLSEYETYAKDNKVTRYVQEVVNRITDEEEAPIVVITHNDEPDAFALPGYVVVSDSMLKNSVFELEFEEVAGLLVHEWLHVKGEHAANRSTGNYIERIGRQRSHETEADILGLEELDKHGINPLGMVTLFEKLEQYQIQKAKEEEEKDEALGKRREQTQVKVGDITHGSLLDRRLNLEELLWLLDIRNLSTTFTPTPLYAEDFDTYQRDEELYERYDQLSSIEKNHFIRRQFKIHTQYSPEKQAVLPPQEVYSLYQNLLLDMNPTMPHEDIKEFAAVSLIAGICPSEKNGPTVFLPPGMPIATMLHFLDSPDAMQKINKYFSHQTLYDLGIQTNNIGRGILFAEVVTNHILSQDRINLAEYRTLIESIPEDVAYITEKVSLFDYMKTRNVFATGEWVSLTNYVVDSSISLSELETFISTLDNDDFSINEQAKQTFIITVFEARVAKVQAIRDPIEFFKYMDEFGFGTELDKYSSAIEHEEGPILHKANVLTWDVSIKQILSILNTYASKHTLTMEDRGWLETIGSAYEITVGEEHVIEGSVLRKGRLFFTTPQRPDEIKDVGNLRERLTLWAITKSKQGYLAQLNTEIKAFQFKNLDDVVKLADSIRAIPEEAKEKGFPIDWEVTDTDLNSINEFTNLLLQKTIKAMASSHDVSPLVATLERFTLGNISANKFSDTEDTEINAQDNIEYIAARDIWEKSVAKLLSKKEHTNEDLVALFALGYISDDLQVGLQVPQAAMKELVTWLSFDEAVTTIFERYAHLPQYLFSQAIEYLIEEKAQTPQDFERLETYFKKRIEGFLHQDEVTGKIALADGLLVDNYAEMETKERKVGIQQDTVTELESVRLLRALLTTAVDDHEMQGYLLERWWLRYRTHRGSSDVDSDIRSAFQIEDIAVYRHPSKENRLNWWRDIAPDPRTYKTMPQLLTDTYLANGAMKYYLLRKLLIGDKGVLTDEESRNSLIETFLNGRVDFGDSSESETVVRELITALFTVTRNEELYQRLNPILLDMILRIPEQPHSLKDLAQEFAHRELQRMSETSLIPVISEPTQRDQTYLTKKIYNLMTGGSQTALETGNEATITRLLSLFSEGTSTDYERKVTPLGLAMTVGKRSGAAGIRALQLAGQYYDIAEEDRDEFMQVYDSMKGQSRLQAYRTLHREAEHSPYIATLLENVAEMKPRIGGGSLVTQYDFIMKDGSELAVGIRNPNVEYHVGEIIDSLKKTIAYLREQQPDNKDYQLFEVLLSNVEEWIHNELTDPRFEEKDQAFRQQNDSRYGQFDNADNKYGLLVPESIPTGTRWIRAEQFVKGKNLTGLTITDGETNIVEGVINKEDYRHATSLITRNYIYQLTETGLVHSDMHPGNFRITLDNKHIAIFDRYNLLELDENEKIFIQGLVPAIAMGGADIGLSNMIDFIFANEKNTALADRKEEISQLVRQNMNGDFEQSILNAVGTLQQNGVDVPLKISLIARNLFALNLMAKEGGFESLVDAYGETATEEEVRKLLSHGMQD